MRNKIFQNIFLAAMSVFLVGVVFTLGAIYSRISHLYTLSELLLELFSPILAVLVLAIVLSFWLAARLSRQLLEGQEVVLP